MGNIEDLLSSIKAQQQAGQFNAEPPQTAPPTPQPGEPKPSEGRSAPLAETRSVEDLLGQLEGHPPQAVPPLPLEHSAPTASAPTPSDPTVSALNALLADLPSKIGASPQILAPSLPQSLDLGHLPPPVTRSEPVSSVLPAKPLPILEDLKNHYLEEQQQREAQERAEQERLRQEREAALARQRQEAERQAKERQVQIEKAAQAWLNQLQPLSGETIWFDEFASHYPSRLAAAIDYLNLDDG